MSPRRTLLLTSACLMAALSAVTAQTLTGPSAFGDWRADKPGRSRHIQVDDLPHHGATRSASNTPRIVRRPAAALPDVPQGFKAELFAEGLSGPRLMRVAPNGDIFVAETYAGRIRVLRAADGATKAALKQDFAGGLDRPFGMAFFPSGANPRFLYVATPRAVLRFPYAPGDVAARGEPQRVVGDLPQGAGHWTRDIVFARDDTLMLVSVGSAGNDGEGMGEAPGGREDFVARHPLGASWGSETDRAAVLAFDPEGGGRHLFATGIRNCVSMAVSSVKGDVWCSVNERDGLGDDLVPDYVTRVREGAFYGWPWYYIGSHADPHHAGARADLADKVTVPDVLIKAHSASMEMAFYEASAFPPAYRGDAFVAEHGSWNRSKRTGYKVIRVRMKDGVPTGEYEDFATGFVLNDAEVWGRPVGIAVAHDGALLVSEDASGTIWRISYVGK